MNFLRPILQYVHTESNVHIGHAMADVRDDCQDNINLTISTRNNSPEDDGDVQKREEHSNAWSLQKSVNQPEATVSTKNRKRKHDEETFRRPSSVDKVLAYLQNRNVDQCWSFDDIDLLLGYSKIVKKFSPHRQTVTKFNIAELIMNEELAQQMEDGNIFISSLNSAMTSPETNVTVESAPSLVYAHQRSASQTPLETYFIVVSGFCLYTVDHISV
ncbi:hypothetical protein PR048_011732 [Dryococelus australis]|uniref:Uncharacterized protein n=1 Tax=Dryococelus australis TaxID=614101 RepID=A0ABQ9HN10_9NEOP|nr:hypothetical protein PR048_011732 [Dryococelus australis]